ncbi:Ethanolamine kinase 1 [Chionoecetes opilio]|uniref:ethanolamine kinase n=1 Tax=Chionoecetes opilio TaxID=41210 RepID=A0A8J4YI23_CHIOP|nr:Ethanolamine kinase 1 [Chionoecetes opilio]
MGKRGWGDAGQWGGRPHAAGLREGPKRGTGPRPSAGKHPNLTFKTYTAGVTNILVGVWCGEEREQQVLVRVYGNNTHLFIDRQQEIDTMKAVHAAGCGPQVFVAFTNGLCYAFTPGVPLTIQDVTREPVWRANARQMASFHKIQRRAAKALLFTKLRQFLALLPPAFTDPKKQRRDGRDGLQFVSQREAQGVWLRSYLAQYRGVSEDEVEEGVVELWLAWVTKFTLASHLFWGMWGFLQACHSSIDF